MNENKKQARKAGEARSVRLGMYLNSAPKSKDANRSLCFFPPKSVLPANIHVLSVFFSRLVTDTGSSSRSGTGTLCPPRKSCTRSSSGRCIARIWPPGMHRGRHRSGPLARRRSDHLYEHDELATATKTEPSGKARNVCTDMSPYVCGEVGVRGRRKALRTTLPVLVIRTGVPSLVVSSMLQTLAHLPVLTRKGSVLLYTISIH